MSREEMRLLTGRCISQRLESGGGVQVSFAFLREILGDWRSSAAEFQAKINAFAHEFCLFGTWDWDDDTHVTFRREQW
jgi:hypothetical protein